MSAGGGTAIVVKLVAFRHTLYTFDVESAVLALDFDAISSGVPRAHYQAALIT